MTVFRAWCPAYGETEEDAAEYHADAEEAAERHAAELHSDGDGDNPSRYVVHVRRILRGAEETAPEYYPVVVVHVDVDWDPTFTGRVVRETS